MFVQVVNPITGKVEWVVKEDADAEGCYSDIAASGYSDMLHDQERVGRGFSVFAPADIAPC